MVNKYIKPETVTVKFEQQQHLLAGSDFDINTGSDPINGNQGLSRGFDFFSFEEEEEAPGKSDDEDWEDWEDEDDP